MGFGVKGWGFGFGVLLLWQMGMLMWGCGRVWYGSLVRPWMKAGRLGGREGEGNMDNGKGKAKEQMEKGKGKRCLQ